MEPTYLKKLPLLLSVRLLGYQAGHHLVETCRSCPAANRPLVVLSTKARGVIIVVIVVLVVLGCMVLPSATMWWCTHRGSGTLCHRLRRAGWCP